MGQTGEVRRIEQGRGNTYLFVANPMVFNNHMSELYATKNRFGERTDYWNIPHDNMIVVRERELASLRFHTQQTQHAHDLLDAYGVPECECPTLTDHIGCMSVAERIAWLVTHKNATHLANKDVESLHGLLLTVASLLNLPESTKRLLWNIEQ